MTISTVKRHVTLNFVPNPLTGSAALFFWGPRQVGKTTFLREHFPDAHWYDLLDSEVRAELSIRPRSLRERLLAADAKPPHNVVVLDEIQKVPDLLDEVHWLLENTPWQLILCGSSARKLRRVASNLLGGRAVEHHLGPFTTHELGKAFDLDKALSTGTLPLPWFSPAPATILKSYVNAYLREEILDESLTRNIPAFARFLEVAALNNGQQLNYSTVARDCGVSAGTVRNYYQILRDTLLGYDLQPWRKSTKRRLVETAKHYLFDVGVARRLHPDWQAGVPTSSEYGRAFEHLLINEARLYLAYTHKEQRLYYWQTHSGKEVDLIMGAMQIACEFKSSRTPRHDDLRGLRVLKEDHPDTRCILVSRVAEARRTEDGIDIWPWQHFCQQLWSGQLI